MKLLVFSSTTCGPCRMMAPIIEAVTKELGVEYTKIMNHERPHDFVQFEVKAVPTLIVVDDDGNEIRRKTGMVPRPQLKEFLS